MTTGAYSRYHGVSTYYVEEWRDGAWRQVYQDDDPSRPWFSTWPTAARARARRHRDATGREVRVINYDGNYVHEATGGHHKRRER